jgi:hypothetical protein
VSEFQVYWRLGFEHISDVNGFDHILFIVALCAIYRPSEWKRLLVLITAFTVGHSVALALSALRIWQVPAEWVEFFIPATIMATALHNALAGSSAGGMLGRYLMALGFGLVHGMGFSNFFLELMGKDADLAWPLFSFNVGLEVGQLLIVALFMAVGGVAMGPFRAKPRDWNLFISGLAFGMALLLLKEKAFFL